MSAPKVKASNVDLDAILDQALDDFEADQLNARVAETEQPKHVVR